MNAFRFAIEQHKPVATFRSDGTRETSGNEQISGNGRTTASMLDLKIPRSDLKPAVFSTNEGSKGELESWLQRLSSST
jgi:hypothetical protein